MEHTTGRWFFPVTPVSTTNKTDSHDITEIWLKVAFNTINQTKPTFSLMWDTNSLKIVREFVSEESNTQLNLKTECKFVPRVSKLPFLTCKRSFQQL